VIQEEKSDDECFDPLADITELLESYFPREGQTKPRLLPPHTFSGEQDVAELDRVPGKAVPRKTIGVG
jgi:hypothetical protein